MYCWLLVFILQNILYLCQIRRWNHHFDYLFPIFFGLNTSIQTASVRSLLGNAADSIQCIISISLALRSIIHILEILINDMHLLPLYLYFNAGTSFYHLPHQKGVLHHASPAYGIIVLKRP